MPPEGLSLPTLFPTVPIPSSYSSLEQLILTSFKRAHIFQSSFILHLQWVLISVLGKDIN